MTQKEITHSPATDIKPTRYWQFGQQNVMAAEPLKINIADHPQLVDIFNGTEGWAVLDFTMPLFSGASYDYVFVISDGYSNNTIGFRISNAGEIRAWCRRASSAIHSNTNGDITPVNTHQTVGITWKPGEITLVSGGKKTTATFTGYPTGLSDINIFSRNASANPVSGTLHSLKIGEGYLSMKQLGAEMHHRKNLCIMTAGQSNAQGLLNTNGTALEGGKIELRTKLGALFPDRTITCVNGATGGSFAVRENDPNDNNWWIDTDTGAHGLAFNNFYNALDNAGISPNIIIWAQGESDASFLVDEASIAKYEEALLTIFGHILENTDADYILIQKIGAHDSAGDIGYQNLRDLQQRLIDTYDYLVYSCDAYNEPLRDQVHFSDAGNINIARRHARRIAQLHGKTISGIDGVSLASATLNGTNLDIKLQHDGGNDFTPSSGQIDGFVIKLDGVIITYSTATYLDHETVRIVLDAVPTGALLEIYYAYGKMQNLNYGQIIYDNAASINPEMPNMPLRSGKISIQI